jgi:hypothetical protein
VSVHNAELLESFELVSAATAATRIFASRHNGYRCANFTFYSCRDCRSDGSGTAGTARSRPLKEVDLVSIDNSGVLASDFEVVGD